MSTGSAFDFRQSSVGPNGRVKGLGNSSRPPSSPLRRYFSRRQSSQIRTNDLPLEQSAKGVYTPAGIFFVCLRLTVPVAYMYILLIILRELCMSFPEMIYAPIQTYVPFLANVVSTMEKSSTVVEIWVVMEAIFYICLTLHIQWLHYLDPLELSLSSAPMLELAERRDLWDRIIESERDDPVSFITGWFFDQDLENISKYDVLDFCAWSMFEGRNQEHLTAEELRQLHGFVEELEHSIDIHLHGAEVEEDAGWGEGDSEGSDVLGDGILAAGARDQKSDAAPSLEGGFSSSRDLLLKEANGKLRRRPRKSFRFHESTHDDSPSFFTNLYEDFKSRYEQYKQRLENTDFHPVQDVRNFMAEKRQQIYEAEETAMATAAHMYENAYSTLVSPGSSVDKQLTALSHATHCQLTEAWNSMREIKGRLETAKFLSLRRKRLQQQLKGYRILLDRMRSMSSAVPSKQMADVMRKITQCNDALERIEWSARDAFVKATGYARKNILQRKEPQRYAKYSYDPILGIVTYPLMFHLLILGATEGGLRMLMRKRGFERQRVGPVSYYYHPGNVEDEDADDDDDVVPIVFCHGIGIGLIVYLPLIDDLLKLGRPIFLPEIPYVSGFRTWQSPYAVLPPASVTGALTAMLATHGHLRAVFAGHSYGTSWLSYMCKYAPSAMAAVLFLDPICFSLHSPRLTKQFVYHRADPGVASYMVRTDIIINWTIQRGFPWARISLFSEQIPVPCAVFVSECDALVPAARVEKYLKSKGAPVRDMSSADTDHFLKNQISVTIFRGDVHGGWTEKTSCNGVILEAVRVLCERGSNDCGGDR